MTNGERYKIFKEWVDSIGVPEMHSSYKDAMWQGFEAGHRKASKVNDAAPELLEALQWALPLAKIAMSSCQLERVKCGHSDITGTYKDGVTWAGIYQDEVDSIESAESAINKALGE